jgi:putative FmdB family regulatory protein
MPVYDYLCIECNSTYDVFHKGQEVKEDVVCPSCGSAHNKKLMSVPIISIGPTSSGSEYSKATSCDTGGCCGGGACGLN